MSRFTVNPEAALPFASHRALVAAVVALKDAGEISGYAIRQGPSGLIAGVRRGTEWAFIAPEPAPGRARTGSDRPDDIVTRYFGENSIRKLEVLGVEMIRLVDKEFLIRDAEGERVVSHTAIADLLGWN